MIPRVQQVMRQARPRVLHGNTRAGGKLVKVQEVENQLITHHEVLKKRPADATLLLPWLQYLLQQFGRAPRAPWRPIPDSFPQPTKRPPRKWESNAFPFRPTELPANSGGQNKRNGGARNCRNGAPVRRTYQRPQTPAWGAAIPPQRSLWNEPPPQVSKTPPLSFSPIPQGVRLFPRSRREPRHADSEFCAEK
jgi:hypothetical protein